MLKYAASQASAANSATGPQQETDRRPGDQERMATRKYYLLVSFGYQITTTFPTPRRQHNNAEGQPAAETYP